METGELTDPFQNFARNEFAEWGAAGAGGIPTRPTWLPSIEEYRTPEEDWARLTSQIQPFWSTRAPIADIGQNLQARYLLGAPYMAEHGFTPSFSQFLKDYPQTMAAEPTYPAYSAYPGGLEEIRRRAGEAARASVQATGPYLAGAAAGTSEWNRRAWLASQFGSDAAQAASNQMRVANLLALQREGGGTYRGRMADSIRNAISNLYQQRLNVGEARESFLDWYLRETEPQQTGG